MTRAISIEVQERDLALLRGLFESRLMTLDHAAALYFDGKREMAKKRVQKLKTAGYIGERPRYASAPAVLHLAAASLRLLRERGVLAGYPRLSAPALLKRANVSDLTLAHELEVMSVKAALVSAIRPLQRLAVTEFSTWPLLNQFTVSRSAIDHADSGDQVVKPDGFIRIREISDEGEEFEHAFFLEVDRSSESQEKLARKVRCYLEYYRSGGYAQRMGASRAEYQSYPFIVLFVCKSEERRDNAMQRMLANTPPTLTQAWLTTFKEVTFDPFGAIWIRPRDYRDAAALAVHVTTHAPFDRFAGPSARRGTAPAKRTLLGD